MHRLLACVALGIVFCTGCSYDNEPSYIALTRYDCAGAPLTVRWAKDFADVDIGDNTYRLARAISGSGARYADKAHEIWEHQGELSWTDTNAARVICRKIG